VAPDDGCLCRRAGLRLAGALAGLESWVGQLNDAELAVVRPYVILARAIIAEVP
jgi:hypothetical protein